LGVDLFIRDGRNIRLTPIGKIFLEQMEQAMQLIEKGKRQIEQFLDPERGTVPIQAAIERVRSGEAPELSTREKHLKDCYVVAEEGADKQKIEDEIKNMPNYFADYDTKVTFITEEELKEKHAAMPHGGFVIRSGQTGKENKTKQIYEFSLKLESNPEFTASVMVAYARAAYQLYHEGQSGAKTVFDIPLAYLSSKSSETLRKELL